MIPAKFDYIKANSVSEAVELLDKHGYDAKLVSGGHSLIPSMKLRLMRPEIVIDISKVEGLNSISEDGGDIVIGANCTHNDILTSDLVNQHVKVLADTAKVIGDIQVRNRGTIGGSLAHADPAADYPATILATSATIEVAGSGGQRVIEAADFFQGIYTTALEDNEVITAIRFPKTDNATYLKFYQSASRFAVVGCCAVKTDGGVAIGLTGVADSPYRATAVEDAFSGDAVSAAAHATDGVDVMGDNFASPEYRSHLARVFTQRAIEALA